jgi:hypothetical protein
MSLSWSYSLEAFSHNSRNRGASSMLAIPFTSVESDPAEISPPCCPLQVFHNLLLQSLHLIHRSSPGFPLNDPVLASGFT